MATYKLNRNDIKVRVEAAKQARHALYGEVRLASFSTILGSVSLTWDPEDELFAVNLTRQNQDGARQCEGYSGSDLDMAIRVYEDEGVRLTKYSMGSRLRAG